MSTATKVLITQAVCAALLAFGGNPVLAQANGAISACVDQRGNVRIVVGSTECKQNETSLAWNRNGVKVADGIYDVHTRMLWDIGSQTPPGTFFAFGAEVEGLFTEIPSGVLPTVFNFYGPLEGRGIPAAQPGSVRRARLYATYGQDNECSSATAKAVTVRMVQSGSDPYDGPFVDFDLPLIGGSMFIPAADWSQYVDGAAYSGIGTMNMFIFVKGGKKNKDYDHACGTLVRIEAHFYDVFPTAP